MHIAGKKYILIKIHDINQCTPSCTKDIDLYTYTSVCPLANLLKFSAIMFSFFIHYCAAARRKSKMSQTRLLLVV